VSSAQYLWLPSGAAPPDLPIGPFRAVIVIEEPVEPDWRNRVSEWLVKSGCLYMVAWGHECSAWDDSVDWANLDEFGFGEIPEERFVLTSWHEKETLAEAFWFAANCAFHSTVDLPITLIIHVSELPGEAEMLELYRKASTAVD
jgi:hypothetical protein